MTSRKEDEKNERIIRGLLKLPDNRRCINCNSVGPQYVCTNFWTFICTTCSGIHREFTHRVKSISMARFTSQEVASLQEGGNKRAKEIFFKDWDLQRNSFPDSSNVERLRDFIKHVYVNRRYSSEKNADRLQGLKMGEKEDLSEHRRTDMSQGVSRSPTFSERSSPGGRSDDRNYRYGYDERSPGYNQDRKSPARPEIVTDWRREDRFGTARRESDHNSRSPDTSSPPQGRPIRDILGKNALPPRINEPPKPSGGKSGDGFVHTQRTASSSSLGAINDNPVEVKWKKSKSLIDFDTNPEPPAATGPSAPQKNIGQPVAQAQVPSNDSNWASFDFSPVSQPPTNVTPPDSVLSELSVPASGHSHTLGKPGGTGAPAVASKSNMTMSSSSGLTPASVGNYSTISPGQASINAHGTTPSLPPEQWPSMHHQQPSFNTIASRPFQAAPVGDMGATNQNSLGHLSASAMQAPQAASRPVQDFTSGVLPQPSLEVQSSGRKELPADLFTATYPSYHAPFRAWQTVPPQGMGYMMQYNTAMPMQTHQQPSRSVNPFDIANEPRAVQTPVFPSMTPLQGALPNIPQQSGFFGTSSFGTPSPALLTPQAPSYMSSMQPVTQSFMPAMPPGPYNIRHHPPSNMPLSSHQQENIGSERSAFSTLNTDQQQGSGFPQPGPSNPPPFTGGNPFG